MFWDKIFKTLNHIDIQREDNTKMYFLDLCKITSVFTTLSNMLLKTLKNNLTWQVFSSFDACV